jgi:hypothetical protein
VIDAFIAVVWIVYAVDLFVAAVPGAWTFRGRPGAMRATAGPDVVLSAGFALTRLPVAPWHAACVALGSVPPPAPRLDRVRAVMAATRPVAAAASVLAAVLLAGLPAIRVGWVTPRQWVVMAAVAWATAVALFVRAHRTVHGRWPSLETWFGTLLMPIGASRSVHALQWRSLDALHPIEAAVALCDDAEVVRVARRWCYDAPADTEAIRRLLEPRRLATRLADPPPLDADASPQYCPRCGTGYAAFATACVDCRVPVVARTP